MNKNYEKPNVYRIPNFLEMDNVFSNRKIKLQKLKNSNYFLVSELWLTSKEIHKCI